MGRFLSGYGDEAYDHEGYAAQVLDDGSLTATYSNDTAPRMIGQVVGACDCGWTGATRYPTTEPFDEAAEERALAEWEHVHARPTLEAGHVRKWDRLHRILATRAADVVPSTPVAGLSSAARRHVLNQTLTSLDEAAQLARELLEPLAQRPGNGGVAGDKA